VHAAQPNNYFIALVNHGLFELDVPSCAKQVRRRKRGSGVAA
jgi:hypothetical protein